jgi:hypothetical protein
MNKVILITTLALICVSCADNHKETKQKFKFQKVKPIYIYDKNDNRKTIYIDKEDSLNLINS